jgi:hypothetical protein
MRLKKTFVYILFLIIFYSTNADAIRKFKFPDEKLPPNFCENLLSEFKFSQKLGGNFSSGNLNFLIASALVL